MSAFLTASFTHRAILLLLLLLMMRVVVVVAIIIIVITVSLHVSFLPALPAYPRFRTILRLVPEFVTPVAWSFVG